MDAAGQMDAADMPYGLSLVVPAFNESELIENTVREIVAATDGRFRAFEVILVDDGSTDRTGEIMDRLAVENSAIRVLHNGRNIGLGASYVRGIGEAKYEYLMMLCGDGGLPADSLGPIYDAVGTADIVVPYMTNLKTIKTPVRYALSRTYTRLLNLLFGQNLRYYNGLPVHRRDLLNQITVTSQGFGFQGEILIKLLKAGCSYVEVSVLGAETKRHSTALRPKNLLSIATTLYRLIAELASVRLEPSLGPLRRGPVGSDQTESLTSMATSNSSMDNARFKPPA